MMLKNKFLFCTILIILGIMFFGGSSCSAYTKKIPASSVYYETSTTKYCDPTDFYAMTDWGSSRDNRTGEMAFNLNSIPSEVTIISAKICAYTNFNFGAPFMNYIEKLVQVTCSTSPWGTEVPYWNIGSATITADYGWKCINITPSEVTKAGNFYIRWWGNDQNEQQTGFVRYSGTNSTLSRCVSNPSGASNCGPYIDITYEVPVDSYNLILIKNGTGTGYVSAVPSGISCGTNCSQIYDDGISVTLYATAYSGSTFAGWSGSCSGTSSSCTVAMTSAKNVTATFNTNIVTYGLSVSKIGTGSGTISSSPSGISCGTDCYQAYNSGTSVTLYASASSGSTFAGWSGSCSGTSSSCTVAMTSAKNVTATFNTVPIVNYALHTYKSGTGSGTISSSPSGIYCGTDCYQAYNSGTSVTLYASASSGSTFAGWSGSCSGTSSSCTVAMTSAKNVTATFNTNIVTYGLSVSKIGTGSGTISSSPSGISCGTDCYQAYNSGTSVTLYASAASGSNFAGWGGSCSGISSSCIVSMIGTKSAIATFSVSADYYRVYKGQTTRIMEHNICRNVKNNSTTNDVFVPTKTLSEWTSLHNWTPNHIYLTSCTSACTNDCSYSGQTETQCSGNYTQKRTCGYYDSDTCLDWSSWSNVTNCDASDGCSGTTYRDYYCSGGGCTYTDLYNDSRCVAACTNDCSYLGQTATQCSGNWIQSRTCENNDTDTCLDWSSWSNETNCDASDGCSGTTYRDYYCSGGSCTYTNLANDSRCVAACTNECSSGSIGTQCSGSYIQSRTCGYYDSDTCLDWSSWSNVTNCDSSDGCIGTTYRDYYCSGTTCNYNDISNSSECGVTCRGACALTGPDAGRCDAECGASSQCDGVAAHTSWSSGSTCYACGFCSPDDCAAGASDNCALTTDPDKEPTYEAIGDICYYNCSNYCVSDEFTARAEWRWAPINQTSYACSQDSDKACDDATCSSTGWNNIACQYTTTKYIRADAVLGRYVSGTHYCNSGDTRISGRCIPDNASDKTEYTTSAYPNGWTCDFSCDTWLCRADGDIELVCE